MLIGAIVGWAILSPYAKRRGWAEGDVDDWQNGARGWIVWVSLAALLADASVQLSWFLLGPIWRLYLAKKDAARYCQVSQHDDASPHQNDPPHSSSHGHGQDNGHRPSQGTVISGWLGFAFLSSVVLCTLAVHAIFGGLIPWYYTILAIALSLPMAIVGIRSLAETDYNPERALGKLNTALDCSLAACVCHPDPSI
jgi:hypothetical protein